MSTPQRHHDWHSRPYVEGWIRKDRAREAARRPVLRRMLAHAGLDPRAAIAVIDIGAGYGAVSAEVLAAFPAAHVTLQDYSPVMLDAARDNLAAYAGRLAFIQGDLGDSAWTSSLAAPFDLAVSAIAIHNLDDAGAIAACYRTLRGILKPGGWFLNCDHVRHMGGSAANLRALEHAGFAAAETVWEEDGTAILAARA